MIVITGHPAPPVRLGTLGHGDWYTSTTCAFPDGTGPYPARVFGPDDPPRAIRKMMAVVDRGRSLYGGLTGIDDPDMLIHKLELVSESGAGPDAVFRHTGSPVFCSLAEYRERNPGQQDEEWSRRIRMGEFYDPRDAHYRVRMVQSDWQNAVGILARAQAKLQETMRAHPGKRDLWRPAENDEWYARHDVLAFEQEFVLAKMLCDEAYEVRPSRTEVVNERD